MIPSYDKIHNRFKLNEHHYSRKELKEVAYSFIKEGLAFEAIIGDFLIDWLNDKSYVEVKTSGSTGAPKTIRLDKQAMVFSAIATGDFFGLKPGDKALHCLPTNFIAGKMMLVRAMILGLEIKTIQPTSHPIFDPEEHFDFCAMIPLQLDKTIDYIKNIKTIIVGGAKVSNDLKKKISNCGSSVFETYGMTETITHIAIKLLNDVTSLREDKTKQSVECFKILPNITITQDERDCLVIKAPNLSDEIIITNDVVKLHSETEFEWLGRFDNVINSGGLKINPEHIESQLEHHIEQRFFIASEPDETLGERLVLILESEENNLSNDVFKGLEKNQIPKDIYTINQFIETDSGKVQRTKTLEIVLNKIP